MKDKIKQHLKKKYPSMSHDDTFIDSRVELINDCIQDLGLSSDDYLEFGGWQVAKDILVDAGFIVIPPSEAKS